MISQSENDISELYSTTSELLTEFCITSDTE